MSGQGAAGVYTAKSDVDSIKKHISDGNLFQAANDTGKLVQLGGDIDKFSSSAGKAGGIDPLQTLISAGLDFLLDLIQPLKEALDLVTGDSDSLDEKSEDWTRIAEQLRDLGPTAQEHAQATATAWQGEAGDAFRTKIDNFARGTSTVAGQADHVASMLRMSSTLMEAAQDIIKGIISSWVEFAIITEAAAAAASVFTFGASEAAGQAAIAGDAARAIEEGSATVEEVTGFLDRLASELKNLGGEAEKAGKEYEELSKSLKEARSTDEAVAEADAASGKAAKDILKDGTKDALKDGGRDVVAGELDNREKTNQAQAQDGHESQGQVNSDLSFSGS